eukprot:Nitzschia sp. Nitz4//scaffold26_size159584//147282//150785//NITZ4_002520-RA/size159584-processed-gene-0.248-mRNA-1//-1//CDS//3329545169//7173//frame0
MFEKDVYWVQLEHVFDWTLMICFLFLTTLLNLYALAKLRNIIRAVISTRFFTDKPKQGGNIPPGKEPMVTIQISCFNEGNVIEDTINAACDVDWPKDKLTVQICDDSTDETIDIIDAVCERWRERGVSCERLTRPNRVGYKAGCLHYHTDRIQGDFVAMFDADHRCENQFLRRCVPHFFSKRGRQKRKVGLVQCPWAYYNTHENLLTEYDALNLDTAFVLEQTGRSAALGIFSFNGTGGIWRKQAIQAGGGWSWETITEDLDLSYESYMAGYQFIYLRDLPQQLELPAGIRAHVQQKYRWTKGFFQVARKTLFRIFRNPLTPILLKIEVFFQYTGAIAYTLTLCVVFLAPILSYRRLFSPMLIGYTIAPAVIPLFGGTCTIFGKVSGSNHQYKTFASRCKRMLFLPTLYMFALGMMIFETHAMYDGMTSDDATFVRTPKEGTPVAGDQKLDYKDDEDECRNDEAIPDDMEATTVAASEADQEGMQQDIEQGGSSLPIGPASIAASTKGRYLWSHVSCLQCLPTLSKKGQKFKTNLTNGMMGLLMGVYLCTWAVILFLDQHALDPKERNRVGYIMTFALPFPAVGLFYVHGTFTYQLLSMKFKSMLKKRTARKEERKAQRLKQIGDDNATVNTEAMSLALTLRSQPASCEALSKCQPERQNSLRNFLENSVKERVVPTAGDQDLVSLSSSIGTTSTFMSPIKSNLKSPVKSAFLVEGRQSGRNSVAWSDISSSFSSKNEVRLSAWSVPPLSDTRSVSVVVEEEENDEEEKQEDDGIVAGMGYFAAAKRINADGSIEQFSAHSHNQESSYHSAFLELTSDEDSGVQSFDGASAGGSTPPVLPSIDGLETKDVDSMPTEGNSVLDYDEESSSLAPESTQNTPKLQRPSSFLGSNSLRTLTNVLFRSQHGPQTKPSLVKAHDGASFALSGLHQKSSITKQGESTVPDSDFLGASASQHLPTRKLSGVKIPRRASVGASFAPIGLRRKSSTHQEAKPPVPDSISFHESFGSIGSVRDLAVPIEASSAKDGSASSFFEESWKVSPSKPMKLTVDNTTVEMEALSLPFETTDEEPIPHDSNANTHSHVVDHSDGESDKTCHTTKEQNMSNEKNEDHSGGEARVQNPLAKSRRTMEGSLHDPTSPSETGSMSHTSELGSLDLSASTHQRLTLVLS